METNSRILVAVSSAWASEKMAGPILDLARRLNAAVLVAHVARASEQDDTTSDTRQRGEQVLTTLVDYLTEGNIQAEPLLLFGDDIARAVLNAAEAHDATMIVLGLTNRGRVARFLAGDIPIQLTRSANIPVLLCPSDWSGQI